MGRRVRGRALCRSLGHRSGGCADLAQREVKAVVTASEHHVSLTPSQMPNGHPTGPLEGNLRALTRHSRNCHLELTGATALSRGDDQ